MNEFRDFEELRAKTPAGKARVAAYRHALEDALGLAELREKKGMTQRVENYMALLCGMRC